MVGWIVLGVIALGLVTLAFAGAGRYRHGGSTDTDVMTRHAEGMRNASIGGGGF